MSAGHQWFYVLPKLFIGTNPLLRGYLKTKHVRLEVLCQDLPIQPEEGKIRLGRPVPNKGYIVACDKKNRLGWFVPLPKGLEHLHLAFLWEIHAPEIDYWTCIEHLIHVNLLQNGADNVPGNGDVLTDGNVLADSNNPGGAVWSMDVMPWCRSQGFDRGEPPIHVQPTTWLSLDDVPPVREARPLEHPGSIWVSVFPAEGEVCSSQGVGADTEAYEEDLVIPPIPVAQLLKQSTARFTRHSLSIGKEMPS